MKKLLSAMLALTLAFSLAACGGTADAGAASDTANTAETEAAADEGTGDDAGSAEAGDAAESDLAAIQAAGKMYIGYTEYAPMNYHDEETGEFTGFDTELATMVCEILGVEPEFVKINWDTKFIDLEAGNIDAVWNGMTLSDDIEENQACTKPYAMNAQVVVMKADNDYTDTSSLIGKEVAVEAGSAAEELVDSDETLSQCEKVLKEVQTMCLMEVDSGTSAAAILDLTLARAMIGEGTDYADLVIVDTLNEEQYGVAFRKGSDVAEAVNAAFDQLVSENKMYELSQKYDIALADGMLPAAQ